MSAIKYQTLKDLEIICTEYIDYIEKTVKDKEYRKVLLSYIAYPYCVWMGQSKLVKDARIKQDIKRMKRYSYILKYNIDPDVKLITIAMRCVGFQLVSWLLSLYIKRKNHIN